MKQPGIKVFISYAWESPSFRIEIKKLADWLNSEGGGRIKVITDHDHKVKPPKLGWPVWMENSIEEADIVLVVCTSKYIQRFRKKEKKKGAGKGVTWEGAIITSHLYNLRGENEKFYPIIPDGGKIKDIPVVLQAYDQGISFPSGKNQILELILNGLI